MSDADPSTPDGDPPVADAPSPGRGADAPPSPAEGIHGPITQQSSPGTLADGGQQRRIPRQLGGFAIEAKLGQGGMGAVFRARQLSMDRVVALKVLPPAYARDAEAVERFQREARAAARINHPNIVRAFDSGRDEATGLHWFAMEYVDGPSLRRVIRERGTMTPRAALLLLRDLARGLAAAHRAGVIHRDIKPDNILAASDGTPKLADLGLAKQEHDDASLTQTGRSMGTPLYMAPEQVRGQLRLIDGRTDLYALGATVFHLVTGRPPFLGETSAVVLAKHLTEDPPAAAALNPRIGPGLSALLARLMAKDRDRRVASAEALEREVEALLAAGDAPSPAIPASQARLTAQDAAAAERDTASAPDAVASHRAPRARAARRRQATRRPAIAAIGAVVLIVLGAALGVVFRGCATQVPQPTVAEAPPPPAPADPLRSPPAPAAPPPVPAAIVPPPAPLPAPASGAATDEVALHDRRYRVLRDEMTWAEADRACRALGGHLAVIENAEQNAAIERLIVPARSAWIGLVIDASGKRSWVTGAPVAWTNWADGQPDNAGSDCGARMGTRQPGRWMDAVKVSEPPRRAAAVCQLPPAGTRAATAAPAHGANEILLADRRYRALATPMTWNDAHEECRRLGGHLAVIESAEQQEAAFRLAHGLGVDPWIGLLAPRGKPPAWATGAAPVWTNWADGEPDNNRRADSAARLSLANGGRWHDSVVVERKPAICQLPR